MKALPVRKILQKLSILRLFILGLVLSLTAAVGTAPAFAQATVFKENVKIPIEPFQVFIPCAAGGAGEVVDFQGSLHILLVFTIDSNGGVHGKSHFQPQGVSGVGLTTGDKYQATGVTQDHFNSKVGFTTTFVNNFRIIGQGPGNNFLIHETFHITINANGEVTAEVDNFRVECK